MTPPPKNLVNPNFFATPSYSCLPLHTQKVSFYTTPTFFCHSTPQEIFTISFSQNVATHPTPPLQIVMPLFTTPPLQIVMPLYLNKCFPTPPSNFYHPTPTNFNATLPPKMFATPPPKTVCHQPQNFAILTFHILLPHPTNCFATPPQNVLPPHSQFYFATPLQKIICHPHPTLKFSQFSIQPHFTLTFIILLLKL